MVSEKKKNFNTKIEHPNRSFSMFRKVKHSNAVQSPKPKEIS